MQPLPLAPPPKGDVEYNKRLPLTPPLKGGA